MSDNSEIQNQEIVQRHYSRHPIFLQEDGERSAEFGIQVNAEIGNQNSELEAKPNTNAEVPLEQHFQVTPFLVSDFPVPEQQRTEPNRDCPLRYVMTSAELSEAGRHPAPFSFERIAPMSGLVLWGGDAKAGKTINAIIGCLEASRKGALYNKYFANDELTSVYFNLEMDAAEFGKRYNEICAGLGMEMNNPRFLAVSDFEVDTLDEESLAEMELIVKTVKANIVVVDTMAASALYSEQDGMKIKRILFAFKKMAKRLGILVIVLVHHGKKNKQILGHPAMLAIPDAVWGLHRLRNGRAIFEIAYNRHAANEGETTEVQIVTENNVTRLEIVSDEERTICTQWKGVESPKPDAQQIVLSALVDGQWRQRSGIESVCRVAGVMPKDMDVALRDLLAAARIKRMDDPEQKGRGNRKHVYRLSTTNQQAG